MGGSFALRAVAMLVGFVWAAGTAYGMSGFSQSAGPPQFAPEQLVRFAKKVEREVAAHGARVALISRVGRSPRDLPPGIEFTHVGFVVYSRITTEDDKTLLGYAVHNLYQSADVPNTSYLKQDFPLDYYARVYELRAGVIIPEPELQERLLKVIFSDTYRNLHNPRYSAISNPAGHELQNCTEFVLDVMNAAIYRTDDLVRIKANIEAYFEPQPVNIDGFKLWLASMFVPDIALSDHQGPPRTATFHSIARYMERHGMAEKVFFVEPDEAAD